MPHPVILGAGPAGVIAAKPIRKNAPMDSITIIGDESEPPYSRMAIPYLLMGNIEEAGTYLRQSPSHFAALKIKRRPGRVKTGRTTTKHVGLEGGKSVAFDPRLIATGSHPVPPPIAGI